MVCFLNHFRLINFCIKIPIILFRLIKSTFFHTLPPEKKVQVRNAAKMFTELSRLPQMSVLQRTRLILDYYRKGYYQLYCKHGKGVMMGDLLFLSWRRKDSSTETN